MRTHTSGPHLDLLLQEVDFVLLLQKLLLLPGNLGTEHTHYNVVFFLRACIFRVCVRAELVGDAAHLRVSEARRLHDRGSMPLHETLKLASSGLSSMQTFMDRYESDA